MGCRKSITMNKTRREIDCLNRLQSLNTSHDEILEFLFQEGLASREEIKGIRSSPDVGKMLQKHMMHLSNGNKIQLLEYEWSILPVERIKIMVVTDRNSREFSYNF